MGMDHERTTCLICHEDTSVGILDSVLECKHFLHKNCLSRWRKTTCFDYRRRIPRGIQSSDVAEKHCSICEEPGSVQNKLISTDCLHAFHIPCHRSHQANLCPACNGICWEERDIYKKPYRQNTIDYELISSSSDSEDNSEIAIEGKTKSSPQLLEERTTESVKIDKNCEESSKSAPAPAVMSTSTSNLKERSEEQKPTILKFSIYAMKKRLLELLEECLRISAHKEILRNLEFLKEAMDNFFDERQQRRLPYDDAIEKSLVAVMENNYEEALSELEKIPYAFGGPQLIKSFKVFLQVLLEQEIY